MQQNCVIGRCAYLHIATESVVVLNELILTVLLLEGVAVLKELIFKFLLWEGVVVWKELILSFYFRRVLWS